MTGSFHIGVMQGRLLPKYQGRYQAHPVGYWQNEFDLAKGMGLQLIEFILDFDDALKNPLMNSEGLNKIKCLNKSSGVQVKSVCADYFMAAPLHSSNPETVEKSLSILDILLINSEVLGVKDVVIPCVDQSSLEDDNQKECFIKNILPATQKAEKLGINLALETDLAPAPFKELLDELDCNSITVNYDTGNSASLGYDPEEEFNAYGNRISDIHIKDRLLGGGPVPLGQGNVDFQKIIGFIADSNFKGPLIFQAYRDDEGKTIFRKQLDWFKNISGF